MERKIVERTSESILSQRALQGILGIQENTPLQPAAMAASLKVTFLPGDHTSTRVNNFTYRLSHTLSEAGVSVLPPDLALFVPEQDLQDNRLVVFATGNWSSNNLPVDHVTNLRTTTIVGILDGACPSCDKDDNQERLNGIIQALAWNVAQMVIFVEDQQWTICTMNGAIIVADMEEGFMEHVRTVLIPKLAAPVIPPRLADYDVREGQLNLLEPDLAAYVHDFEQSSPLWARTGVMLFHTPVSTLKFRSRRYQRIVSAFLDHRTGMSYGFLARQLAVTCRPALTISEADALIGPYPWEAEGIRHVSGQTYVLVNTKTEKLVAHAPEVWVLTTRSGCDKARVEVEKDLIMLGLVNGKITVLTPTSLARNSDCKPSYDTLAILSHAAGNALAASIILRSNQEARFPAMLVTQGAALGHWHGYITPDAWPLEYVIHGQNNLPVSCSTNQSAIFALTGKLEAACQSIDQGSEFLGDIHIEPYHGTNITGPSLVELAKMVLVYGQ